MLVDLRVPRIGGSQVIEFVKRDPDLKSLPIVLYTGFDCEHARKQIPPDVQPDHCRSKPSSIDELSDTAKFVCSLLPPRSTAT